MANYYDKDGNVINLGIKLGSGGEGDVYEVAGQSQNAIKLYKQAVAPETVKKLELLIGSSMVANTAWPLSFIYDSTATQRQVVGYIMHKASGRQWHEFNQASSRGDITNIKFTTDFFFTMLINYIEVMVDLHAKNIVIGDVNDANILVDNSGSCIVIDVDSFQVGNYLCDVARPEFRSPDLQQIVSLSKHKRSTKHDCFALGILVWQLLFNGVHPFQGKGDPTSIPERIQVGLCFMHPAYSPPDFQADYNRLPRALLKWFRKAFSMQNTSANELLHILMQYERAIKVCLADFLHLAPTFSHQSNAYSYQANASTIKSATSSTPKIAFRYIAAFLFCVVTTSGAFLVINQKEKSQSQSIASQPIVTEVVKVVSEEEPVTPVVQENKKVSFRERHNRVFEYKSEEKPIQKRRSNVVVEKQSNTYKNLHRSIFNTEKQ